MAESIIITRILHKQLFTQEDFTEMQREAFKSLKHPSKEQEQEFELIINGGPCPVCQRPWKRVETKIPHVADYVYYEPWCDCQKKIERDKRISKLETDVVKKMQIPEKYWGCTMRDMDINIDPRTVKAIDEVKKYFQFKTYNTSGLILAGNVGVGKTHIAVSLLKWLAMNNEKANYLFINASDLINDTINDQKDYIKCLINNYDGILLDDLDKMAVEKIAYGSWKYERIYSLVNGMVSRKRLLICTCNYSSENDIKDSFGEAISSRIHEACVFVYMPGDNYRLRK